MTGTRSNSEMLYRELGSIGENPELEASLMATGRTNRAIVQTLGIKEGTVKSHVVNIMTKLEADDRTHAVVVALKRGIIKL